MVNNASGGRNLKLVEPTCVPWGGYVWYTRSIGPVQSYWWAFRYYVGLCLHGAAENCP